MVSEALSKVGWLPCFKHAARRCPSWCVCVCVIMETTYLETVWQQRIRLSPGFPISPPCLPTSDLSSPVRAYLLIHSLLSVPSNHESLKWITLDEGRNPQIPSLPKSLNSEHNAFGAKASEGHSYLYQPALCSTPRLLQLQLYQRMVKTAGSIMSFFTKLRRCVTSRSDEIPVLDIAELPTQLTPLLDSPTPNISSFTTSQAEKMSRKTGLSGKEN